MSRSLKRVRAEIAAHGLDCPVLELDTATGTAAQAAAALGCAVAQIVKSVILLGQESGRAKLFLTSGAARVDLTRAAALAGEPLGKADAALIRAQTGFAIGGVSPFGHISPIPGFMDENLMRFARIWAAAGTPRHMFAIAPALLAEKTGARIGAFTG